MLTYFVLFMIVVCACAGIPMWINIARKANDVALAARQQLNEPRDRVVYIMGAPPQYAPQYALPAPPVPADPQIDIDLAKG